MPLMRAVVFRGSGGTDVLSMEERDLREPGPGEVLVSVAAAGVNRADVLQRRGLYPAPPGSPADIPGLEFAGTVATVGAGVTSVVPGARVMGITGGGAMATYVIAHQRELIPVPDDMSLERAAAVPEAFLTAYDALFVQAGVDLGSRVLIHAVASGVGTAALQLARAAGAQVMGTSRTRDKLDRCAEWGLEPRYALCPSDKSFARSVHALTDGHGADVIMDMVGAAYLEENIRALASRGLLIVVGLLGGISGNLPLGLLLGKRARVAGTVLRARPLEEKAALCQRFITSVLPLLRAGTVQPVVSEVLAMEDIAQAHERMERNQTFGKLVLRW